MSRPADEMVKLLGQMYNFNMMTVDRMGISLNGIVMQLIAIENTMKAVINVKMYRQ